MSGEQGLLFACEKPHLEEIRKATFEAAEQGTQCPCCDQRVQVYRRNIYATPTKWLVWLVDQWSGLGGDEDTWVHKNDYPWRLSNGDYGRWPQWGMARLKPHNQDPKKTHSGLWQPTPLGVDFVCHRVTAPLSLVIYDNRVIDASPEHTCVRLALKKDFDVLELNLQLPYQVAGRCTLCAGESA